MRVLGRIFAVVLDPPLYLRMGDGKYGFHRVLKALKRLWPFGVFRLGLHIFIIASVRIGQQART